MKLELRNKGSPLQLASSETYPYQKGEQNGAEGPKYASLTNFAQETEETNFSVKSS